MTSLLVILMVLFSPFAGMAQDAPGGYVQVTLEYKSLFPGTIQVVDGVCSQTRSIDCAKAGIRVNSERCRKKNAPDECKEAKALLGTSFCMEGLIFEGRAVPGEKIRLNLCVSDAGFGNMTVRDVAKGPAWTNYTLLNDGQSVSFP